MIKWLYKWSNINNIDTYLENMSLWLRIISTNWSLNDVVTNDCRKYVLLLFKNIDFTYTAFLVYMDFIRIFYLFFCDEYFAQFSMNFTYT